MQCVLELEGRRNGARKCAPEWGDTMKAERMQAIWFYGLKTALPEWKAIVEGIEAGPVTAGDIEPVEAHGITRYRFMARLTRAGRNELNDRHWYAVAPGQEPAPYQTRDGRTVTPSPSPWNCRISFDEAPLQDM